MGSLPARVLRLRSPDTAQRAALFLLLPPGPQLLLGQGHLLLHGGRFLFGPPAVLLEKGEVLGSLRTSSEEAWPVPTPCCQPGAV